MPDLPDRLAEALKDRYTLQRELGRGGMATVYLATDVKHERLVALKVLKPELAAVLGADRFLREIKTTAQLTHPHILPLLDSGDADGTLFYVMPYVEGESLRDRLNREKQLPVDDALQISREVADALSYAHSRGVIHRDVKPENILLESGHAVVADFGIARAIDAAGGERLTETGVALGTPHYMSPEQAGGSRELDGRSDLYSLGCVLYEMLAGQPPFTGPTVESLVHQHLAAEPPHITGIRPAVPAHVAATLERSLSKTPADRFNPVALFAEALGPRGSTTTTASVTTRRWDWRRTAFAAVAVVAIAAGAIQIRRWLATRAPDAGPPLTAIAVLPLRNLTSDSSRAYFASGLHDVLLTQLAKVAGLTVTSATSVLRYAGTTLPLTQVAAELGVGAIVEGSVQVDGNRLLVSVQLIEAATDAHLWAEQYDRTLDDIFGVQADVARQIAAALEATLTPGEVQQIEMRPTENLAAYELYLRAKVVHDFDRSVDLLQQAVALDPQFAAAWAALADWWIEKGFTRLPEVRAEALDALARATSLAPDAFETHMARSGYHFVFTQELDSALWHVRAAGRLRPSDVNARILEGSIHWFTGRWDQTLVLFQQAATLDPLSGVVACKLALAHQVLGDLAEAGRYWDRAISLGVSGGTGVAAVQCSGSALFNLKFSFLLNVGDTARARQFAEQHPDLSGGWLARLAYLQRDYEQALRRYEALGDGGQSGRQATYRAMHELDRVRAIADSQLPVWERRAQEAIRTEAGPTTIAFNHANLAGLYADLGNRGAAIEHAALALETYSVSADALNYRSLLANVGWVYLILGDHDRAIDLLERQLSAPGGGTSALLRLDPRYDPLRDDPRFQALLVKYDPPQPVPLN